MVLYKLAQLTDYDDFPLLVLDGGLKILLLTVERFLIQSLEIVSNVVQEEAHGALLL